MNGLIEQRLSQEVLTLVSLFNFICYKFSGQKFYVVSDRTADFGRVYGNLENCTGITIWEYDKFQVTLPLLESCLHTGGCVLMMLIPKKQAQETKESIYKGYLESTAMHYIFISEVLSDHTLLERLREGTQISVLEGSPSLNSKLIIKQCVWSVNNKPELVSLGWWDGSKHWLSQSWPISTAEYYSDFKGRTVVATYADSRTWFHCENPPCELSEFTGVDYNHLKYISRKLNFRLKVVNEPKNSWGKPLDDGNITGMIGMVARHEAQLAVDEITINEARSTVVDFSYPYFLSSYKLFSKQPGIASMSTVVVSPFKPEMWGLILAGMIGVAVCLVILCVILKRFATNIVTEESSFSFFMFYVYKTLILQGDHLTTQSTPIRMLITFVFIFNLILCASYSAGLVAVLASPNYEKPVDTLEQAVQVFQTTDIFPVIYKEEAAVYHMARATSGLLAELYAELIPDRSHPSRDKRFQLAADGLGISFASEISTSIYGNLYTTGGYIGKEKFWMEWYGIVLPRGSPYRPAMDKVVMEMQPTGLIHKWLQITLRESLRSNRKASLGNKQRSNERDPISLIQLQAAFFVFFGGVILSFIAFLGELSAHICSF